MDMFKLTQMTEEALISDFVARRHASPERQAVLNELLARVHRRKITLHGLVLLMETSLTSKEDATRQAGLFLLSELLDGVHDMEMAQQHVKFYAQFMAERLQDPPCVAACIAGLRALSVSRRLDDDTAVICVESLFVFVDVQSLPFHVRHAAFQLLARLTEEDMCLGALRNMRAEFVVGFLAAADAEADPRNLVVIFPVFKLLTSFQGWEQYESELFESVASYFPLLFTPPPDSPASITQEDLLGHLQEAFTSTPRFTERTVALMMEKMRSSSSHMTRIQALATLARVVERYPTAVAGEVLWRDGLREQVIVEDDAEIAAAAVHVVSVLLKQSRNRKTVVSMVAQLSRELTNRVKEHDDGTFVEPVRRVIEDGVLKSSDTAADLFVRAVIDTVVSGYSSSFRVGKKTQCLILCRLIAMHVVRRATEIDVADVEVQMQISGSDGQTQGQTDALGIPTQHVRAGPAEYSKLHGVFMDALSLGEAGWSMREEALRGLAAMVPVMTRMEAMTAGLQLSSVLVAVSATPSEETWEAAVHALEVMQKHHAPAVITAINALFSEIARIREREGSKDKDKDKAKVKEGLDSEGRLVNSVASLGASTHDAIFTCVAESLLQAAVTNPGTSSVAADALAAVLGKNTHHNERMLVALRSVCPAFVLVSGSGSELPDDVLQSMARSIQMVVQSKSCAAPEHQRELLDVVMALVLDGDRAPLIANARSASASGSLLPFPKTLLEEAEAKAKAEAGAGAGASKTASKSKLSIPAPILNAIIGNLVPSVCSAAVPRLSDALAATPYAYDYAICLASLVNKHEDEDVAAALADQLAALSPEGSILAARALAMRAHPAAEGRLSTVITADSEHLGTLLLGELDGGVLGAESHAVCVASYRADTIAFLLPQILDRLRAALPDTDNAGVEAEAETSGSMSYSHLLRALSSLIGHVPVAVLLPKLDTIYRFVREALEMSAAPAVVKPMLAATEDLIRHAPEFFAEEKVALTLIGLLLRHASASGAGAELSSKSKPSVRIAAVGVLSVLSEVGGLVASSLVRLRVYDGLDVVLDDTKVDVRKAARKCRALWVDHR